MAFGLTAPSWQPQRLESHPHISHVDCIELNLFDDDK